MKFPPFNVPQLLTGLIALGGITLAIVAFDAERVIGAVDDLQKSQATLNTQITLNANDIAVLKPRVGELEVKLEDHEHRLIKLEPR